MQNKKQKLMDVMGFSDKKARVYLALLESGEAQVTYLARKCGLKRTTIYNILPELKDEGLIKTTKQNGRTLYYVEDTRDLERVIETKSKNLKELLPELKKVQNILSIRPKILLYEGEGGMRQLYQEVIDSVSPGEKILTYIGLENFDDFISAEVLSDYINQRISKKIVNRVITNDDKKSEKFLDSSLKELREIKIIKGSKDVFSSDMKIFGNKIALISYKENFFAVIIESKEISLMLKNMFGMVWNSVS